MSVVLIHYSSNASCWCSVYHRELGKWICPFTELLGKFQHVFSLAGKMSEILALKIRKGLRFPTCPQGWAIYSFSLSSRYPTSQSPNQTSPLSQTGFSVFMSPLLLRGSSPSNWHDQGLVRSPSIWDINSAFLENPHQFQLLLSYMGTSEKVLQDLSISHKNTDIFKKVNLTGLER